eukprot:4829639-Ditylum_brightwellii.AAC.1
MGRMLHAVTINTHLFYPTYCLRFDQTGQYFVTGADDQLVKLFHMGCDNALLATASEDGDCRIWGLRDGCPVAILRGHTGGANM